MRHKRRSPRRMCIGRVELLWQVNGRERIEKGMIQDKSKMGLGISVRRAIEPGAVISLLQGFSTRSAIVRHCTPVKRHFVIGIEWYTAPGSAMNPDVNTYLEPDISKQGPEAKPKRTWN